MRKQIRAYGVNGTDLEWRIQLIFAILSHITDHTYLIQNALGLLYNALAGFRYANAAFAALKQRHAQLVFQFFDRNAECWLAYVTALGGAAKMPFAGKCNDVS